MARPTRPAVARAAPALLAALVASAAAAGPGEAPAVGSPRPAIEVEDALCRYAVDFDPARISEERVRGLLRFAEQLAGNWDGEYVDTERNVWMFPPDEVAAALPRMDAVLARLDADVKRLRPPRELEPVVRWVRDAIEFDIWLDRVELDYCTSDDPAVLRRPFRDLDPAKICAKEIEAVRRKFFGRCKDAAYTWGNCVNVAFRDRAGPYPQAAWDAFLGASGIRLRKLECDEP
jgi:hypothetical protein